MHLFTIIGSSCTPDLLLTRRYSLIGPCANFISPYFISFQGMFMSTMSSTPTPPQQQTPQLSQQQQQQQHKAQLERLLTRLETASHEQQQQQQQHKAQLERLLTYLETASYEQQQELFARIQANPEQQQQLLASVQGRRLCKQQEQQQQQVSLQLIKMISILRDAYISSAYEDVCLLSVLEPPSLIPRLHSPAFLAPSTRCEKSWGVEHGNEARTTSCMNHSLKCPCCLCAE